MSRKITIIGAGSVGSTIAYSLSQEELAKKAGISRSLISAIEAPRLAYNFTLDVLLNIANALDARAEELLKGDWQAALK